MKICSTNSEFGSVWKMRFTVKEAKIALLGGSSAKFTVSEGNPNSENSLLTVKISLLDYNSSVVMSFQG